MRAMASRGAQAQGAAQPSAVCRSSFGGRGVSYSAARIAPRSSTSRQQVVVQAVSAGPKGGAHRQRCMAIHLGLPVPFQHASWMQRKLSMLRKKMWNEAGPPPDLATRLFTERIMYLVSTEHRICAWWPWGGGCADGASLIVRRACPSTHPWPSCSQRSCSCWYKRLQTPSSSTSTPQALRWVGQ